MGLAIKMKKDSDNRIRLTVDNDVEIVLKVVSAKTGSQPIIVIDSDKTRVTVRRFKEKECN